MKQTSELITIQEAAEMLGLHPETLRRWDRSGKLRAVKVNERGDRRYAKDDILKLLNKYKNSVDYEGYEIHSHSVGFELFPNRFGSIARYIVKKQQIVCGFAFAVPGLELFALPHLTDKDLESLAYEVIKKRIDQGNVKHLAEYTYDFHSGHFTEVSNPEWWNSNQ